MSFFSLHLSTGKCDFAIKFITSHQNRKYFHVAPVKQGFDVFYAMDFLRYYATLNF